MSVLEGLTLEDLIRDCEDCNGTGRARPVASTGRSKGFGRQVSEVSPNSCPKCHGKGAFLTESGRVLVEFINHAKRRLLF
jgi:DnaJ-class molecular chaperone